MRILKYKKKANGIYIVFLDNGDQLSLYEEVILKYGLLLKKEISIELLDDIMEENKFWELYSIALKSLKARFKSVKELSQLLVKKDYPTQLVEKVIDKLLKQKYLDDYSFAKSYINNQIITTSKGPNKIAKELELKWIRYDIICELIKNFDEETQRKKLYKLITKELKRKQTSGGNILRNKISNYLTHLGYDSYIIREIINEFDFKVDANVAKKEYQKLYQKLSRKYEGKDLENKIHERLYQKGLYYEN